MEEKAWICWDALAGRASWASWGDRVAVRGQEGGKSGLSELAFGSAHTDLHEAPLPGL